MNVFVGVAVLVGVFDAVGVFDGVKVLVGVGVSDGVGVIVGVAVAVGVLEGVEVAVGVGVFDGVGVRVEVAVGVAVSVGVGVGDAVIQVMKPCVLFGWPLRMYSARAPDSPMPLRTKVSDWPAAYWNDWLESTPPSRMVSVPASVIGPPLLLTVNVDCSSLGVKHCPEIWIIGWAASASGVSC